MIPPLDTPSRLQPPPASSSPHAAASPVEQSIQRPGVRTTMPDAPRVRFTTVLGIVAGLAASLALCTLQRTPPASVDWQPSAQSVRSRDDLRRAVTPTVVTSGAALRSDPIRSRWGANATLTGPPPALLLFSPHKTGSSFFAPFLHDLSALLGLCWYTDNAAFMYSPLDRTKCASPSCGHAGDQRRQRKADTGWGECSSFVSDTLGTVDACRARGEGGCAPPLSAQNGLLWGPLRLPDAMRQASARLGSAPWRWYVVLHQRHPLDTLVSQYRSFGWTHPAPFDATAHQRLLHSTRQSAVRNTSVDDYVSAHVAELKSKCARAPPSAAPCPRVASPPSAAPCPLAPDRRDRRPRPSDRAPPLAGTRPTST